MRRRHINILQTLKSGNQIRRDEMMIYGTAHIMKEDKLLLQ